MVLEQDPVSACSTICRSGTVESGVDRIYGDMGDDEIFAAGNAEVGDSAKGIVDCGPGTDTAYFDEGVDVVKNCEIMNPPV